MSELVYGIGTGHSPMCSEPPQYWAQHGEYDLSHGATRALLNEIGLENTPAVSDESFTNAYTRTQAAIDALRARIAGAGLDALIIVGDDQDDLFKKDEVVPTLAVFCGESYINPVASGAGYPDFYATTLWGHSPVDGPETYPCHPELALSLVSGLSADGLGPAIVHRAPSDRRVGHAFTFVNRRLLEPPYIPTVPVMLNTYYPPNQPTLEYAIRLGESIAKSVLNSQAELRVGMVASGGLTHPIVDESLDRAFLEAIRAKDYEFMLRIPEAVLREGSTEFKNWITVARAMDVAGLSFHLDDYIPAYRTDAGTGIGLTFGYWN